MLVGFSALGVIATDNEQVNVRQRTFLGKYVAVFSSATRTPPISAAKSHSIMATRTTSCEQFRDIFESGWRSGRRRRSTCGQKELSFSKHMPVDRAFTINTFGSRTCGMTKPDRIVLISGIPLLAAMEIVIPAGLFFNISSMPYLLVSCIGPRCPAPGAVADNALLTVNMTAPLMLPNSKVNAT